MQSYVLLIVALQSINCRFKKNIQMVLSPVFKLFTVEIRLYKNN